MAANIGQRIRGYAGKLNTGSGKGNRGRSLNIRWGSRWRPPKNVTTKIRLLPASYVGLDGGEYEYFQYVEFFSARANRGFVSSKKWKIDEEGKIVAVGGDCIGYDEWKKEMDEDRENRSVSLRLLHAFNVLHLAWYHLVPVLDDKGNPKLYQKGERKGQPIYDRLECEGRRCPHCKEGHEKVFGKKVHWSMGSGHLQNLAGIIEEVEKDCANCGTSGSLTPLTYECSKCGEVFVDMERTEMSDEEVYEFSAQVVKCDNCGNEDYPLKQFDCSNCQDPKPTSIFDVDLDIKRTGEGTQSTVQVARTYNTELSEDLIKLAGEPFNFKDVFAPDPFEIQAKSLKVRNPYGKGDSKPSEHTEDYEEGEGNYEE